jgi:hypothetical protein
MKSRYIFCLFVILALVSACARPPVTEMDNARLAVFTAENDPDAIEYGAGSLVRARSALALMQTEADSKRYDVAKAHAEEAIAAAETAVSEGKTGAARARQDAASAVSVLQPEIEDTSRNLNAARYSDLPLDYNALERDLMNAYTQTDRAQTDYTEGRYKDALDKARNVRSNLSDINRVISTAIPRSKS